MPLPSTRHTTRRSLPPRGISTCNYAADKPPAPTVDPAHPVDTTLSLLHASAVSRGVPHKALRNLALLASPSAAPPPSAPPAGAWEGLLEPGHAKYQPARLAKVLVRSAKQRERDALQARGAAMIADVRAMAEGAGGLVLGRVEAPAPGRQRTRRRR